MNSCICKAPPSDRLEGWMDDREGQEGGYSGMSGGARPRPVTTLLAALPLAAALLMTLLALAGATPATAQAARPSSKLRVGSQTLTLCGSAPLSYCGTLSAPLDYATPTGPRISIAYRFYPASAPPGGQAAGTVVPVEGGPGYPS